MKTSLLLLIILTVLTLSGCIQPPGLTPKLPEEGIFLNDPDPVISWRGKGRETRYQIQISTDRDFRNLVIKEQLISERKEISWHLRRLLQPGNYYIRIGTGSDSIKWGEVKAFSVEWKGVHITGDGKYYLPGALTFRLEAIEGIQQYEIQISEKSDFSENNLTLSGPDSILRTREISVPGHYYLRTRNGYNNGIESAWSETTEISVEYANLLILPGSSDDRVNLTAIGPNGEKQIVRRLRGEDACLISADNGIDVFTLSRDPENLELTLLYRKLDNQGNDLSQYSIQLNQDLRDECRIVGNDGFNILLEGDNTMQFLALNDSGGISGSLYFTASTMSTFLELPMDITDYRFKDFKMNSMDEILLCGTYTVNNSDFPETVRQQGWFMSQDLSPDLEETSLKFAKKFENLRGLSCDGMTFTDDSTVLLTGKVNSGETYTYLNGTITGKWNYWLAEIDRESYKISISNKPVPEIEIGQKHPTVHCLPDEDMSLYLYSGNEIFHFSGRNFTVQNSYQLYDPLNEMIIRREKTRYRIKSPGNAEVTIDQDSVKPGQITIVELREIPGEENTGKRLIYGTTTRDSQSIGFTSIWNTSENRLTSIKTAGTGRSPDPDLYILEDLEEPFGSEREISQEMLTGEWRIVRYDNEISLFPGGIQGLYSGLGADPISIESSGENWFINNDDRFDTKIANSVGFALNITGYGTDIIKARFLHEPVSNEFYLVRVKRNE